MVVFKMLAVLKNSLPSGQRIKENIKIISMEKFYFENETWNNL